MEIPCNALLDSISSSFEIAVSALMQANVNIGMLGLDTTKREVTAVIEDLRKAITVIDVYKHNKKDEE